MHGSLEKPTLIGSEAHLADPNWPRSFVWAGLLLVGLFAKPLAGLVQFALSDDLYSHVILIPFISAYLVWNKRASLPPLRPALSLFGFAFVGLGFLLLGVWFSLRLGGITLAPADSLALTTSAFVALAAGLTGFFAGLKVVRSIAFPLAFLVFMVPFPEIITNGLETASKHASAEVYAWLMNLSGATYFREGLVFALPHLTIQVAQECSGIRSSFVLFLTSLLAGHMFLRGFRSKAILALVVFPLGVLRNAFRIFILSILSVHWDPNIIDSPLHHRGGPLFFVLSLVPFFLCLLWLRRAETRSSVPCHSGSYLKAS